MLGMQLFWLTVLSWKLPAYSGAFVLTSQLCFRAFLLTIGSFFRGKELGPWRLRPFYANQNSELSSPFFYGKTARIQKKEGFIRTPPNRYGPSSSLSNFLLTIEAFMFLQWESASNKHLNRL